MSLLPRQTEIDELSDLSWKRIEGRVFETLDSEAIAHQVPRRRIAFFWPALCGASVLALGVLLYVATSSSEDTVAATSTEIGSSFELEPARSLAPVRSGTPDTSAERTELSQIVTHTEGSQLEIGAASVDISPNSSVAVAWKDGVSTLLLEKGRLRVNVKDGAPLVVQSGKLEIEAIDSSFSVSRTEFGAEVEVVRGSLTILSAEQRIHLRAKARWPLADGPSQLLPSNSKPALRSATTQGSRKQFEEGQRLEASSPQAAIAAYRKVSSGTGPWAANALFAHGRLEMARGKGRRATRLLQRYLRKFPKGANSQDARELLQERPEKK